MPRLVRTARGELIDFDTIIIKQQLAQAPMNIEVARRKEFIDSKEGRSRGSKQKEVEVAAVEAIDPVEDTVKVDAINVPPPAVAPKKKVK